MYLAGRIKFDGEDYFLCWKDIKSAECFWVFSPYHKDDALNVAMGNPATQEVISSEFRLASFYNENYVLEIMKRLKVSGGVQTWGQPQILDIVLDTIMFAKSYKFANKDTQQNLVSQMVGSTRIDFKAQDNNLLLEYVQVDSYYRSFHVKRANIEIQLTEAPFKLKESVFTLTEADRLYRKRVLSKTIKDIDYNALCESLDMSWYKKDNVKVKDYRSIDNLRDFELQIMTPLVHAIIQAHSNSDKLDVAVDTETSGLNVYKLAKNNPDKDHVVAIPISWVDDAGFVIFTDMEHFANVNNDYVSARLGELFSKFSGQRTIEVWEPDEHEYADNSINKMDLFGNANASSGSSSLNGCHKVTYAIEREWINLIGHNAMFDKKAFIDSDQYFYFDNDTMQMAFDISSKLIKGSNKLKVLTRRNFGHETPELTDILGKGNEDKYRFLTDREVAEIYGCADADYTRKLFPFLRKLMSDTMYERYQALDVPLLNILPRSEYYGLPIYEDKALALGDNVYKDIERLKEFAWEYVGAFVSVYKQRERLEAKKAAGLITDDEYNEIIGTIKPEQGAKYEFEFTPTELRSVVFDILKYPIISWTTSDHPQPKLDKYVMEKLIKMKRSEEDKSFNRLNKSILVTGADEQKYEKLLEKGDEKGAGKYELISASEFNKTKHPLALILRKYAELNKEYTAYFKPIKETNMEGKIFKSYSLARIETRRIQNAAQTMKGNLKALVHAYNDDYYLLDFDMSQVEYRIMLSLAGYMEMVERMKDPERDYHTETASLVNNIPAHKVDKKTRKNAKSVSFGVPYGLGDRSLCDKIFGVINDDTLFKTRLLLSKWKKSNKPVMDFLNKERDNALVEQAMSNELRDFMDAWVRDENGEYARDYKGDRIPKPTGFIYDKYGFYRTFDLSKISQDPAAKQRRKNGIYNGEEAKIRRPAGNFPIQCFAAELFRIILIRFYNRCEQEGINDKIIWHMLIHDELLCSVHKSIHPFFIYKIVKESCMVTMKGHTKYFVGINIGNTWGEVKDDAREAPVYFVDRIIKRWDAGEFGSGPFWFDDPWNELIRDERAKYVDTRINELIHQVQPNIDHEPINVPFIMEHFDNYTVRAYINDYSLNTPLPDRKMSDDEKSDRTWSSRFETWALGHFPEGKPIVTFDSELKTLHKYVGTSPEDDDATEIDLDDLFAKDDLTDVSKCYWSFDADEINDAYDAVPREEYYSDDEDFMYDLDMQNHEASTIADMLVNKSEYEHLQVMYEQTLVTVSKKFEDKVKQYLNPFISSNGTMIVFKYVEGGASRWLCVNNELDWAALDQFIADTMEASENQRRNLAYKPQLFTVAGNNIVITLQTKAKFGNCMNWLRQFENDNGYTVILKSVLSDIVRLPFKVSLQFKEIDNYLRRDK